MNQVTTLTGVEEKAKGSNDHGDWVLRVFSAAGGGKFQTFNTDLGEKAVGLIGKSAELEYEIEDSKDGKYKNNVLKSIRVADGASPDPTPAPDPVNATSAGSFGSDRPIRSHETNRSDALGHAIRAAKELGIAVTDLGDLFKIADANVLYIETVPPVEAPDEIKF